jgi:hypothetical protein
MFRFVPWSALVCALTISLGSTQSASARAPGYFLFGPPNIARPNTHYAPPQSRLIQKQHRQAKGPQWQPPRAAPRAYAYGWFGARPQPQYQVRGSYYGNYTYAGGY